MRTIRLTLIILIGMVFCACGDDWLSVKRDLRLVVPTTLSDMRALLNNSMFQYDYLRLAELSADDYEITDITGQRITPIDRNAYTWQKDIYEEATSVPEWDDAYKQVFQANVVLDGLAKIVPNGANLKTWQVLKGEALFYRAKAFYNLAQLFSPAYDQDLLAEPLGIPLRLEADVNVRTVRSTMAATYDQITGDLRTAALLLDKQASSPYNPGKATAYAQLARCYLVMGDFENAGFFADSSLKIRGALIDYNTLNTSEVYPFDPFNVEVLLPSTLFPMAATMLPTFHHMPRQLLQLYGEHDLRRTAFFYNAGGPSLSYRGSYRKDVLLFQGATTAEMLLIRAECAARRGHVQVAMDDLNHLRVHRYTRDEFRPLEVTDAPSALAHILTERRKELVKRGIRWQDLRRLNKEPQHAETLSRTLSGITYTLPPGDSRYVMPIPNYIINITGIEPNNR